jgi:EF-P beta-lysylation protein EpmB
LFKLRVTKSFAKRMQYGDARDPLLLQVLPLGEEHQQTAGFSADPVGDLHAQKQPGLLHKYQGRVLLVATGSCAINCRYCFRREYPYSEASATQSQWQQSLEYIAADDSISEVILSGGDPLMLSDKRLDKLISHLEAIPHLKRLRVHSRLPVVLPSRITDGLVRRLSSSRLQAVMVIHSNHAQELDQEVGEAINKLKLAHITCLNQAVLLKNINNSLSALSDLSERLFEIGVLPYYLHLLDKVEGAAHFDVSESQAVHLMAQLQAQLPGYLVPKLVREIAGQPNKTSVFDGSEKL